MKQKVMIICAFIVNPSLLIVDEPFLGLDPLAISDLIELLAEEKAKGKAILMSTHVLDSAEKMCDCFVILHHGQALFRHLILKEKIEPVNYMPIDILVKENIQYYNNYI